MEKILRLVRTTTFRLALIYTGIFSGSVVALFIFIYVNTTIFAEGQIEDAITAEVQGFSETYRRAGIFGLAQAIERRVDPNIRKNGVYILTGPNGQPIAGNLTSWPRNTTADDEWISFSSVDMTQATEKTADVRAMQLIITPGGYRLLVGRDIEDLRNFREVLLNSLNIALGITIALGILSGFLFSRSIVRKVEDINRTCIEIMQGDLSRRIQGAGENDEFSRLSNSLNKMLDQIERLMKGLREVSDNVAHDLRTPLNRLRSRLEEVAETAQNSFEKKEIEKAIAEADSLLSTFSALLRIARAEASLRNNFKKLNLTEITKDVAELYTPLAEDKGIKLLTQIDDSVMGWGDPHLIAQAAANLIDNAIKYTQNGDQVEFKLGMENHCPVIEVADTGPGIPSEYHKKVFERLYRLDKSRSTKGAGLGLSLVDAVAKSHDLSIKLENKNPGLNVRVKFPNYSYI